MTKKRQKSNHPSQNHARQHTGITLSDKDGKALDNGQGPTEVGRAIAHLGHQILVEDSNLNQLKCHLRQNLPDIVVGDKVIFSRIAEDCVITQLEPRRSLFGRYTENGQFKPIAANVSQIIIVIAAKPQANLILLDRYLILAENLSIPAVICFNKTDLLSTVEIKNLHSELHTYEELNYPVCYVSAQESQGLSELTNLLKDQTSVFIGQSGVGKSSISQLFLPQEKLKVGALSTQSGKGKHTTTTAQLYHFTQGGVLIDAPGIRDLPLNHFNQEALCLGFKEFRPYLSLCKFNNCTHVHEPGCIIKNKVESGEISAKRFKSYQQLVAKP